MDLPSKYALWMKIVGEQVAVPGLNSSIRYFPRLHYQQSTGEPGEEDQFPDTMDGTVDGVGLEFTGMGYPFVKFSLAPRVLEEKFPNMFLACIVLPDLQMFKKTVTYTEMGGNCVLNKKLAKALFPGNPLSISFTFVDGTEFCFAFKEGRISNGWNDFILIKDIQLDDILVFMKINNGNVIVGVKRLTPPKVDHQMIINALELAGADSNYVVQFFPHAAQDSCVELLL